MYENSGFPNTIQNIKNPLAIFQYITKIGQSLGFDIFYDPESNKTILGAKLPDIYDNIQIFLPFDFDPCFFSPQMIEFTCNVMGNVISDCGSFINYTEVLDKAKYLIILALQKFDSKYQNVEIILNNQYDFTFVDLRLLYAAKINFIDGRIQILMWPLVN